MTLTYEKTQSLTTTITLPCQEPLSEQRAERLPETTVTVTLPRADAKAEQALENALELLQLLYGHGVSSPQVLRLILRATGQKEIPV